MKCHLKLSALCTCDSIPNYIHLDINADKLFDEIVCSNRMLPEINKTDDILIDKMWVACLNSTENLKEIEWWSQNSSVSRLATHSRSGYSQSWETCGLMREVVCSCNSKMTCKEFASFIELIN
jgi:hypothetical protein